MFSGASVIAIILAPQLNLLNRILQTTPLTLHQWLICIVAALAPVALTEIRKLMLRRRDANTPGAAPEPAAG
jgi:Ca2+-transporting ATPase